MTVASPDRKQPRFIELDNSALSWEGDTARVAQSRTERRFLNSPARTLSSRECRKFKRQPPRERLKAASTDQRRPARSMTAARGPVRPRSSLAAPKRAAGAAWRAQHRRANPAYESLPPRRSGRGHVGEPVAISPGGRSLLRVSGWPGCDARQVRDRVGVADHELDERTSQLGERRRRRRRSDATASWPLCPGGLASVDVAQRAL